ncbi:efflux RND transporter periplasmic adaptor subunit [Marinospirillum alkaliphilum]|uniref:Membrane fusion protein, multidrug efflux system n=1 Tax=Marinospirillum alkaliphilum DSM 21637 TaxID=1122209 RepID=A0A1K1XYW4_9GAMM|nr:efflux RND transporter periplasmic adaptor subunit [Marinospirillum alkaliphilum]SFX54228.1 membrane fusion protein, multidrug efflux system [Marinospirillum alkaliphilum DSM 21637]
MKSLSPYWLLAALLLLLPLTALAQRPAMPVEAVKVEPRQLIVDTQLVGTLLADEATLISSELAGRLAQVHFTDGQRVQTGTRLFSLDASIERAQLERAKAAAELAEVEYQRAEDLLRRNAGSANVRDAALATLRINQAEVKLAEERLAKMTLTAPFHGVLGIRQVSPGDYLTPGQPLVALLATDPLRVEFRIPEVLLRDVSQGQQVEMTFDALTNQRFSGEVMTVSPQVDASGRSLLVQARLANPDNLLRPGMFARVRLILDTRDNALLVPEEALVPEGRNQYVFRIVDGVADKVQVTPGHRLRGEVEITSGIQAGDRVVTAGQLKLRPGSPAQAINLPAPAADSN